MIDQNRRTILLVDLSPSVRDQLSVALSAIFELQSATTHEDALKCAQNAVPDIIVIDATIPERFDADLVGRLRSCSGAASVLVLSPAGQVRVAVEAMKNGASEVIDGPLTPDKILSVVSTLSENLVNPSREGRGLSRRDVKYLCSDFGSMAGRSAEMEVLFKQVEQIARRETTVLITGESGTGKELIAREIHNRSPRRNKPFIALNCAAIPETLIESELFGHERGAFTHAVERRLGQCELADGGTLFLDEIGELSLAVQVKLLRFLQEQEFFRVGRSKPILVDVRVVTATNRNLEDQVRIKQFRQDLLYRINVINLHIPALRDRQEDVPVLIEHCLTKLGPLYAGRRLYFSEEAIRKMCGYGWPGNVRELENVVESLLALTPHDQVELRDLPQKVRDASQLHERGGLETVNASGLAFDEAGRIFETDMIVKALKRANFVQTRAAELLGISRRILKYKMDKLSINDRGEIVSAGSSDKN